MADKRDNPSSYALVVLSEGAEWQNHEFKEKGESDAYGHKKKANVGEDLSDEIQKTLGDGTIVSHLTYDLRSGSPDFVVQLVCSPFAGMAAACNNRSDCGSFVPV